MILVVGATGLLGSEICRLLRSNGKSVRALVRPSSDQGKIDNLQGLGVDIVRGDLKKPTTLDPACQDMSVVISTATSIISQQEGDTFESVDRDGQINLVQAAKLAGVKQFIYISFPPSSVDNTLQDAKRKVEQELQKSGMIFTILQPTNFIEIWLSPALGFDAQNGKIQVYGSGDTKTSWISVFNVAEFAVRCIDHPKANNAIIKLGGPDALSYKELISIFEEASGSQMEVMYIPEDALQQQIQSAENPVQKTFAALGLGTAKGIEISMDETLKQFPVKLISVRDYARTMFGR